MRPHSNKLRRNTSVFLAHAGHELRTPLNAILGMLELSLEEPLSPTLRDYLKTATDSARILVDSLNDVVDLAQADAGQLEFNQVALDLPKIVAAAIASSQLRTKDSQRRITLRISPELPTNLLGDPQRIAQIVANLVAYTLAQSTSSALVFDLAEQYLGPASVRIELAISPTGLAKPFDPDRLQLFEQTEDLKYSAAGLGVTVANAWLQILRGELWISTADENRGEVYGSFELRRAPESVASVAVAPTDGLPKLAPTPASAMAAEPLNVLVADDTQANQKVVKAALARRGHHVEVADNGRDAVDLVHEQVFDVVLMDAQMPSMNGLEATRAIRHLPNEKHAQVPIIALTAHVMPDDRQRCMAAGMDDYLSKPIEISTLVDRVEYYGTRGRVKRTVGYTPVSPPRKVTEHDYISGALSRLGGDETLLEEMIRLFRQDAISLVEKIRQGLNQGDAESVSRAAHNLRGLASNFDALDVMASARVIEQAADSQNLPNAKTKLPDLEAGLDELIRSISRFQD